MLKKLEKINWLDLGLCVLFAPLVISVFCVFINAMWWLITGENLFAGIEKLHFLGGN